MPRFMTFWSYTPEAKAALARKPEDRSREVGELLQQAGGQLLDYYYCFGDYDGLFVFEAPDDVSAHAAVFAGVAAGHVQNEKTVELRTVEEKMAILDKAGELQIQPPAR